MGADAAAVIEHRYDSQDFWWWSASLNVPRDYHYFGVISGTRTIEPDEPVWFKQLRYADGGPGFQWAEFLGGAHEDESRQHLDGYDCKPVCLSLEEMWDARFRVQSAYRAVGPKPWWDGLIALMEGIAMDAGGNDNVRLLMGWDQG